MVNPNAGSWNALLKSVGLTIPIRREQICFSSFGYETDLSIATHTMMRHCCLAFRVKPTPFFSTTMMK